MFDALVQAYAIMHTYIHACIHIYIHIHTYIHTYIHNKWCVLRTNDERACLVKLHKTTILLKEAFIT